jgi:WD40 repeat protein
MHDAAVWRVGDVVADLYRVDEVVGRGGMGLVYRVRHLGWNVDLAVKCPRPELFVDEAAQQRFMAEAQTWVSLGLHPHVCGCHYVRVLGGVPRVFAEYVEAGTLREWIDDRRLYRGDPTDALARVLDVAIQIAWGLAHAHRRGVVHQDIKPGNVLLDLDGTARITDFGLARARAAVRDAGTGDRAVSALVTVGGMTLAYASPEQAARQPIGRRSDVFSFGVTVLELFTGGITWLAGPAAGAALADYLRHGPAEPGLPRMPAPLAGLLRRCLRDDPAERPAGMTHVATTLVAVYEHAVGAAYPRPAPRPADLRADELNNRGVSLLDLGRTDEAEAAFDAARAVDPQHVYSIYNAGLPRWRAGTLTDQALVAQLETARAMPDDHGSAAYPLALVQLERGDVEAAMVLLEEAARRAPGDPEIARFMRFAFDNRATAGGEVRRITIDDDLLSASFGPDGRSAITGSRFGPVCVWDLDSGDRLATFDDKVSYRDGSVACVAVSPDGRWALLGRSRGAIRVRDLTGACDPVTLRGNDVGYASATGAACFSPDGSRLITVSSRSGIRIWDTQSGKPLAGPGDFAALCNREWARAGERMRIHFLRRMSPPPLWGGLGRGGLFRRLVRGVLAFARWWFRRVVLRDVEWIGTWPSAACFSPDGRKALVMDWSEVWLWDFTNRDLRLLTDHRGPRHRYKIACYDADGRRALVGCGDGEVFLLEMDSGRCLKTLTGHTDEVMGVCFSPDGRRALSAGVDRTARLWDLETGRCLRTFTGHTGHVTSVCFSPDARTALTGSTDGTARLWQLPQVEDVCPALLCRPRPHAELADAESRVAALLGEAEHAMSQSRFPDAVAALSQARATSGHHRTQSLVRAWRRASLGCVRTGLRAAWQAWVVHTPLYVWSIGFWDNRRGVVTASRSDGATVWDLERGAQITRFDLGSLRSRDRDLIGVSDDGYVLTVNGYQADLWELRDEPSGRHLRTLLAPSGEGTIGAVCFGSGSRHALTGSDDGNVRLWDLATGDCIGVVGGHSSRAEMCISPDGRHALTADLRSVSLWDLATGGRQWSDPHEHRGAVACLCFSPNGRDIAIGRHGFPEDPVVEIWTLAGAQPSSPACRLRLTGHHGAVLAACFSPDGRYLLTGGQDRAVRLWDLGTGRCLWTMAAGDSPVRAVRFSPDGAFALTTTGLTTRLWALDWDLAAQEPADWDDGAAPYLDAFLARHTGLRVGWTDADFATLLRQLQHAGYGWLRPDGVRAQLERTARDRYGPTSPAA